MTGLVTISKRAAAIGWLLAGVLLVGCPDYLERAQYPDRDVGPLPDINATAPVYTAARKVMVARQLVARDIRDKRVLNAMRRVPRHLFVPRAYQGQAYGDSPLPIGHRQTISQPYVVAYMTQVLDLKPTAKVLEIGTGSGYQAAILGELAGEVYTIEIVAPLGNRAKKRLAALGYRNIHVRIGDGYKGWPAHAPFDAIIVTAAPPRVPQPLLDQLKVGGRMIIPVGKSLQDLVLIRRTKTGWERKKVLGVRFVPMTGKAQQRPR